MTSIAIGSENPQVERKNPWEIWQNYQLNKEEAPNPSKKNCIFDARAGAYLSNNTQIGNILANNC